MKTCSKCKEIKPFSEYYQRHDRKTTYAGACKSCYSAKGKSYRKANKEKLKTYRKVYYKANKERLNQQQKIYYENNKERMQAVNRAWHEKNKERVKETGKAYRIKNREYRSQYHKAYYASEKGRETVRSYQKGYKKIRNTLEKNRYNEDAIYRLSKVIRTRVYKTLKGRGYGKKSKTEDILGISFEGFTSYIKGLLPENLNLEDVHIDHIVPVNLAETEEEVEALNHYSNLRPLSAKENLVKSDRLDLSIVSPENKIKYKTIISRYLRNTWRRK